MHRLKHMKETMIGWLENEISKGCECFDCEAAGEVADMIKDLAEAEEKCVKACYYMELVEAMKDEEEPQYRRRYGYDKPHHLDVGHMMDYDANKIHDIDREIMNRWTREDGGVMRTPEWSEKGKMYDAYKSAKRHYTQTKKSEDMAEMNRRLSENLSNVISQLREMAEDATPEMRKNLKLEMLALGEEIGKMM